MTTATTNPTHNLRNPEAPMDEADVIGVEFEVTGPDTVVVSTISCCASDGGTMNKAEARRLYKRLISQEWVRC